MRRFAQAALLVLSGLGLLHAALFTDLYLNLVKPGMRPLLIASGAVLVALGLSAAAEAWGRRPGFLLSTSPSPQKRQKNHKP
ncbi:hypothetical protein PYK79_30325, partial [Streptomyces sp. ID05-04B]|nr:hypothetical protein [Streptomyces sp. ID05-04B]